MHIHKTNIPQVSADCMEALRERLANYTPEEETDRRIAELRDLLKEISAVKDSMADIITGFTHAVADLQKKDIGARVHPDTLKALNEICTNFVVEVGKQLMAHRDRQLELQKEHEERIARMLERNKGVWVSDGWMKILIVCILLYTGISFIHSLL